MAIGVFWLTSCSEKTEFVSSQSQSNWKTADPAALAAAKPEVTPDIMPQTHYAAGRLFEKQGAAFRAAKQYKKALLRDPEHVPSLSRLGMIYAKQGHYPQAEQYLQKAVELWPNSPQTRNNLGFCYVMQERWYDAEAEFRNTLKLDPSFVRARVNLAMSLSKLNRFDEALGEFKLAVPEPEAYYNLGLLYRSAQRYEEAASAFATALKRNPKMTLAKQQLDRMKLQMERTREYQFDTPAPQSTDYAASNQPQRNQPQQTPASNVRANQSFAMQSVEPQSTNQASSQPVASSAKNAQTASWSNASTTPPANTQPVESAQNSNAQYSNEQYSSSQYAIEPVASTPSVLPMEPVEYSASQSYSESQSDSQHQDTPAFVQDNASSDENLTASNSTQQQTQPEQESTIDPAVETYETYPVVSAVEPAGDEAQDSSDSTNVEMASTEPVESNEPAQSEESPSEEPVQWDRSRFVESDSSTEPRHDSPSEILEVQPMYVAADQAEANEDQSEAPTQLKPIARPVQTQEVATTQSATIEQEQAEPATSNQTQNADTLVLEATPVEEVYAPSRKQGQGYQLVETKERSESSMTPTKSGHQETLTTDLSEIESVEPVQPGTPAAPKKARTATHKSNAGDVEVKPMGKVGMAPAVKTTPQPRTQAMPEETPAETPAPQKVVEPAILEMSPVDDIDEDTDDSDNAKIEEDIEVVEMEPVEN